MFRSIEISVTLRDVGDATVDEVHAKFKAYIEETFPDAIWDEISVRGVRFT